MLEFIREFAAGIAQPQVSAALGFLCGSLAGFRLGLWRHRGERLNDTLRAVRGRIAMQLERGAARIDDAWLGAAERDHIVTKLPRWRRRGFQRAWQQYRQACAKEHLHYANGVAQLRDGAPALAALRKLHRCVRPV